MKKIGLFFILIGILFSSLGSKIYINDLNDLKETEILFKSFIREIDSLVDSNLTLLDKTSISITYKKEIDKVRTSLNRDQYNNLLNLINSISYDDVKSNLLTSLKEVDTLIIKYTSKERYVGKVSAYTAYCSDGCNGYTANGRYIGNNIYYNDKDYGKVRIVAGDRSLPFGTIVRFNNLKYYGKEVYAIVLDRGGAIGNGRRVLFDLLFSSEREANDFGIEKNIECDILRKGY